MPNNKCCQIIKSTNTSVTILLLNFFYLNTIISQSETITRWNHYLYKADTDKPQFQHAKEIFPSQLQHIEACYLSTLTGLRPKHTANNCIIFRHYTYDSFQCHVLDLPTCQLVVPNGLHENHDFFIQTWKNPTQYIRWCKVMLHGKIHNGKFTSDLRRW